MGYYEEVYLKSHSEGSIGGMAFIPEYKIITSGEDNKILLWNLRSKKCESSGQINPLVKNTNPNIYHFKYIDALFKYVSLTFIALSIKFVKKNVTSIKAKANKIPNIKAV